MFVSHKENELIKEFASKLPWIGCGPYIWYFKQQIPIDYLKLMALCHVIVSL